MYGKYHSNTKVKVSGPGGQYTSTLGRTYRRLALNKGDTTARMFIMAMVASGEAEIDNVKHQIK